jgi:hypothetical protein
MRTLLVALVAALALPALAMAQPEDRQRQPTGGLASVDPCASAGTERSVAEPRWPGFDPRVPAPAGATPFTGIAPPGRDPSRGWPDPPALPDQAYQACVRRQNR